MASALSVPSLPVATDAILAILRHGCGAARPDRMAKTLEAVEDWSWFCREVWRHGVAASVHAALQPRPDILPPSVAKTLADMVRIQQIRALEQRRELCRLAEIMAAADLPLLAMKGPLLSQILFDDAGHRCGLDLDILVPPQTIAESEDQLVQAGYRRTAPVRQPSPLQMRMLRRRDCATTFRRSRVAVDLHWRLFANPYLLDLPFDRLWREATQPLPDVPSVRHLDGPDLLLYLAAHGAKHQWTNLKWLEDVVVLAERRGPAVVDAALERAHPLGLAPVVISTLNLGTRLLGGPAVPIQQTELTPQVTRLSRAALKSLAETTTPGTARQRRVAAKVFLRQARLKSTRPYRVRLLTRWLINPKDWERVQLPDPLFPLYLVLRPILWLWQERRIPINRRK